MFEHFREFSYFVVTMGTDKKNLTMRSPNLQLFVERS